MSKATKKQKLLSSFQHAVQGLAASCKTERNLRIHLSAAGLVILFGCILRINATEWCICILLFALVIGAELINTALEALVDLVRPEIHPKAKRAKDTAAAAVLICALAAVAVGMIIFLPKLIQLVVPTGIA